MSFTYKGLSGQLQKHTVTEEEVNRQLQRLLQQSPRIHTVTDRPAQLGDEVVLDYAGYCDDEQFAGGTAQGQTLTLGSGMFIPGFEDQLVGAAIGQEVRVNVTFPEQYHSDALAGKEAVFICKIHEIRQKSQYQLDDTFAKEVGQCDTLEIMRTRLGESLQAYADEQGEMELQDQLLRQAAATLDYTVSHAELEREMDEQLKAMEAQLSQQGLNLDMYCNFMNTTKEALREESRAAAEANLKNQAAIDKIVMLEKIEPSEQEIGEAIALICRQNGITAEQLKPYYTAEFEKAVIRSVLTSKVMRLVRDAATIAEV